MVCNSEKSRFIKEKGASWLLSEIPWNSGNWFIINTIIDKNCYNPNVFIWIFTVIVDALKKLKTISYNIKKVWIK